MRRLVLTLAATMFSAPVSAQQCVLDPNEDGRTAINELIQAVNEALIGCPGGPAATPTRTPTPQPDGCGLQFNDDTSNEEPCSYVGTLSAVRCENEFDVVGAWSTLDPDVIAVLAVDPGFTIGVVGRRSNPTNANVRSWSLGPDFDVQVPTSGSMRLPNGEGFTVSFGTDGCGNLSYDGDFLGTLPGAAARATDGDMLTLLERLRKRVVGEQAAESSAVEPGRRISTVLTSAMP